MKLNNSYNLILACYFNSLIQTHFFNPVFVKTVLVCETPDKPYEEAFM